MDLETIAFLGTLIVAAAYIPQIWHLISRHCAYGISINAWAIWLVATFMILPHTIAVGEPVFIFLISIHAVAIAFITVFAYFHQDKVCDIHRHKFL